MSSRVWIYYFVVHYPNKWYQSRLLICALGFPAGARMSTTMKYDLPLLDLDTRFSLWQVNMRAVLVSYDLDDALEGFW